MDNVAGQKFRDRRRGHLGDKKETCDKNRPTREGATARGENRFLDHRVKRNLLLPNI